MKNNITGVFNNFDAKKHGRLLLIASLIIVLIGALVIGIFGFNLSYEYGGGQRVIVEFESDIRKNRTEYNEFKKEITETINTLVNIDNEVYGVTVKSIRAEKGTFSKGIETTNIIFTTTLTENGERLPDEFIKDLAAAIGKLEFKSGDDKITYSANVTGLDFQAPVSFGDAFFAPLAVVVFIAGLSAVYFAFRYDMKKALAAIFAVVSDALLVCALLAIFRIPVSGSMIVLITAAMLVSVFALAFLFDKMKSVRATPGNENAKESVIVNTAAGETRKANLIVTAAALVIAAALFIGTSGSIYFALGLIVSIAAGMFNGAFAAPAVIALVSGKKTPPKPVAKPKAPAKQKEAAARKPQEDAAADKVEADDNADAAAGDAEETELGGELNDDEELVISVEENKAEAVDDEFHELTKLNELEELEEFDDLEEESANGDNGDNKE